MNQTVLVMVKEKTKVRSISDDRVFPFKKHPVQYAFKKACQRAGGENIHFHDLRHTALSLLMDMGIAVTTVQQRAGHSKASVTTDIYGHSMSRSQDQAAEQIDELVTPVAVRLQQ
jgi:integrase